MRISDWSSDVCSSDLRWGNSREPSSLSPDPRGFWGRRCEEEILFRRIVLRPLLQLSQSYDLSDTGPNVPEAVLASRCHDRSEERRVGKECVSTCRSRGSPYH